MIQGMNSTFAVHLGRYGPQSGWMPLSRAEAQSYCSRLARTHYENFTVASVMLPRRLLPHFHNVYAYCRWADDLADETGGGKQALALLRWWRAELLRCYEGRPRHPVMVALQRTIRRFQIPARPFLDLLFAFEQDQQVKRTRRTSSYSAMQILGQSVGHLVLYLGKPTTRRMRRCRITLHGIATDRFWQDVARSGHRPCLFAGGRSPTFGYRR